MQQRWKFKTNKNKINNKMIVMKREKDMNKIVFNHWNCESEDNRQIYYIVQNSMGTFLITLCLVCATYFFEGFGKAIYLLLWVLLMMFASKVLKTPILSNLFCSALAIVQYIAKAIYVRIQRNPDKYDIFYEEKRKELSGYSMRKLHRLLQRKGKLGGTIYIKFPKVYLVCGFHIYKFKIMVLSPNANQGNLYFDVEWGHLDIPDDRTKYEVVFTEDSFVEEEEDMEIFESMKIIEMEDGREPWMEFYLAKFLDMN